MRESCPVYCYSGIQSLFEVVLLYTFYTFGDDAKGLIAEGNLVEVKRLKFLRTALETKYSELQSLDREIVDLVDDVEVIDTEVCESCELMSSIQECILELESVLGAQESKGKSRNPLPWCNLFLPKARELLKVTFRKLSLMQSYPSLS